RRGRRWLSRRDLHPAGGAASPPTAAACPGAGAPWTRGWVGSAVEAAPPATPPPAARRAGPGRSAGSGPATGRRPPSPGPPAQPFEQPGPLAGAEGPGRLDVEPHLHPAAGPVGVLAAGAPRGGGAPSDLVH